MYKLEALMNEITTSGSITISGEHYEVKNCVVANSDGVLRMCLYILSNNTDQLLRISVESVNLETY